MDVVATLALATCAFVARHVELALDVADDEAGSGRLLHGHEAKYLTLLQIKPIKIGLADYLNFSVVMKVFA